MGNVDYLMLLYGGLFMEKGRFTTKNTSIGYLIGQIVPDLMFVAAGIFCLQTVEPLRNRWRFELADTMGSMGTLFFILAFITMVYHIMVATTVIEVRDDKITGKGLQNFAIKNFRLRFDQVSSMSTSKGILNLETGNCVYLIINTASGNYKIVTTPQRANEIIDYFNDFQKPVR